MLMCVSGMLICAGFGLQASSGGGETEQQGKCGEKRVPSKGDVLEFEMAEESAPGGVEWLSGTVTSVDAKKKNFKAIIKEDEDDESTWSTEAYKVTLTGCILLLLFVPCVV